MIEYDEYGWSMLILNGFQAVQLSQSWMAHDGAIDGTFAVECDIVWPFNNMDDVNGMLSWL